MNSEKTGIKSTNAVKAMLLSPTANSLASRVILTGEVDGQTDRQYEDKSQLHIE